ncbi:MAG: DNA polymerase III subunit gamma/tau [Alphaproteobacteria bacterium]
MSSYLVLARKYRPQNFAELIGQEVLVQTLANSIRNNRLHHGYILTGIRGVGKTTTARIIAKTINCLDPKAMENAMACGVCENCRLISASQHQDVIEIDAASRTGVGDIRQIIDSIAYAPVMAKYKIYIIDEVHMLSNQAFNALLKTLEEPPSNVKFIFATTEIRKVPVTILSRCQRFDLRRLDESEISQHLENILAKENFQADKNALMMIAKSGEGSVRDSLSLLDQALAINNHQTQLSADLVEKMLGLNDRSKIVDLISKIMIGDLNLAIKAFNEIYSVTSDISQLVIDLQEIVHKITAFKTIENYQLEGISSSNAEIIGDLSKKISLNNLVKIWQLLVKAKAEIDQSSSPKINFEMLLIKLCHLVSIPDLAKILVELKNVEQSNTSLVNQNFSQVEVNNSSSDKKNSSDQNNDLVAEILKSFDQAKIC